MSIDDYKSFEWYLHIWRALLTPLLSWNDLQIERWSQRYADCFTGRDEPIHHTGAVQYVAWELLPPSLNTPSQSATARQLVAQIERIIENFMQEVGSIDALQNADWRRPKTEIDKVLRDHGENLETIRQTKLKYYQE